MQQSNLKPCPLDRGPAVLSVETQDERYGYADVATIACQTCGCRVSTMGDGSKGGYADNSKVVPDVIAKWNSRA